MTKFRKTLLTAAGIAIVGVSCASGERGTIDAPIDSTKQENSAPYIVNGPNGYHNLALKCLGADLLVTHTRQAPPIVVVGASSCRPGVAEAIGIPRVAGYAPTGQ